VTRAPASEVVAIASNSRSLKSCAKGALRDDNEKQRGAGIVEVYFDSNVVVRRTVALM
jgi:hypothetical protein